MFEKQSRIIAVDNNQDHLTLLTSKFHKNGLGCLPLLYDQFTPPLIPYSNIRLAFFDINLRDITNEPEVFNDLANALNDYISKDNGPFALIFWTQNNEKVGRLISYIAKRRPETPRPYLISCIDKDEFLPIENDSLETKLGYLLSSPTLDLLLDYEENSKHAASQTINEIYKLIPNDSEWGEHKLFEKNFKIIFSKIAIDSLGFYHAKENPDKAVYEALIPTTSSLLEASINLSKWKEHLDVLANMNINNQPKYPDGFDIGKLNSFFHIDDVSEVTPEKRGAVYEYHFNTPQCPEYYFSLSPYFQELEDFSSNFISLKADTVSKDLILKQSKFIAIEISSVCDFSQSKKRNHKYVLGIMTPKIEFESFDDRKTGQSLFYKELPVFSLNENEFMILINFNFIISDLSTNNILGEPLFILKKEMIDMIGNRYANHVSRIGITTF